MDVGVDDAEVGFLGFLVGSGVLEDFVWTVDACVGDDVGYFPGWGEGCGGLEESELIVPDGGVAGDEFGAWEG